MIVSEYEVPMLEGIVPVITRNPWSIPVTTDEVHVTPVHGPGDEHTGTSGVEPVQAHPVVRVVPLLLKLAAKSHIATSWTISKPGVVLIRKKSRIGLNWIELDWIEVEEENKVNNSEN